MTELATYQPTETALTTPAAMNAGALITGSLALLDGSYRLAQTLVQTNFAPPHFRGKAEEGAVAIMYGAQLGLDPLQSFQNITVISGRPGLYARTMHALVLQAGHRVTITESGPDRVVVSGQRKGSPDVETAEWTTERARRAGYTSNKKYETEPEAMLRARALADVCRIIAPDVLLGLAYTAEELEFIEEPADVTPVPKKGRRESAAALLGAAPEATPEPEPLPVTQAPEAAQPDVTESKPAPVVDRPAMGAGPDGPSAQQITAIYAGMRGLGCDRDKAKQIAGQIVGRDLDSMKGLSRDEASRVLDAIAERTASLSKEPSTPEADEPFPNDAPPAA